MLQCPEAGQPCWVLCCAPLLPGPGLPAIWEGFMESKVQALERTRILLVQGTTGGPIPTPMALCTGK